MPDTTSNITFSIDEQSLIDLLKGTQIFSGFTPEMFRSLLPQFEKMTLEPGQILFEQNSPSDSLYILLEGELYALLTSVNKQQKVIGAIKPGEIVGEMGALSNQPRSLTVKAAAEAKLIRLTRAAFQEFYEQYPKALLHLVETLILRSQNTIRLMAQKKLYVHAILFSGDGSPLFAEFLMKFKKIIADKPNVMVIEEIESNTTLVTLFEKAHQLNHMLVFIVKEEHRQYFNVLHHHIGSVFCFVDGDRPGTLIPFAQQLLEKSRMLFSDRYDLVLLHTTNQPIQGTQAWLAQAHFSLHHHVHLADKSHFERMLRYIRGNPVGLVLGGGGTKISALAGAIKALEEAGIPIDAIGGTSAGAIVGGMYAIFDSADAMYERLRVMIKELGSFFALKNFTWPLISILNAKLPTSVLMREASTLLIEDLWVPYYAQTTNLNLGTESVHSNGLLWQAMRASCSIPGLVPPVVIKGQLHVDGGLLNNLPVDTMQSLLGHDAFIIAVSLAGVGRVDESRYDFPPELPFRVGLMRKLRLGYHEYTIPPFIETFLRSLLVGAATKETRNLGMAQLLVRPDFSSQLYLNNNTRQSQEAYVKGYDAATKTILEFLTERPDFFKKL